MMKLFRSIMSSHSIGFTPEAVWRKTLRSRGYHQPKQGVRQISKRRSHSARSTLDAEREQFYRTDAANLSVEDWRRMDREDIAQITLLGDEPHLADGRWNESAAEIVEADLEDDLSHDPVLNETASRWQ